MKSKIRKILMMCALVISMALGMFAVDVKAADATEAKAIDSCDTRKFLSYDAETAAEYLAGENTYPKLEGYMFAGWYTNAVHSEENLLKDKKPSGTVYALFVPEHVLSVKAQVSAHLIDADKTDADKTSSIRFVTTVDSLFYQQVGFEVSYVDSNGNVKTATSASAKVYKKLYVTGTTASENKVWQVTPAQTFCGLSEYFKACTVTGVPEGNYTTKFTVRPYWITMDGAKVYGVEATKSIDDVLREEVWVSSNGTNGIAYGGKNAPYATLEYAIEHVVDGGTIHITDTYAFASGEKWPSHDKKVTVTGGTLDFSAKSEIYIDGDVTFSAIELTLKGTHNDDTDTYNTAIFAEGHELVIKENVTFTNEQDVKDGKNRVEIIGGSKKENVASTNLKIYAGSYYIIYGGAIDNNVTGDTNVVVGKNVNSGASYTDHNYSYLLFGGGCNGTVYGNTNVTVENGATFNYVYGGGYLANSKVEGATNIQFNGSAMSIFGGSYKGTNGDTNIVMNGGTVEQIFGGCEKNSMTGNTNVQVLGGTVVRRIYGGCYNDTTGLTISTSRRVTGHTNVLVGPSATISLNSTGPDYTGDAYLCAVSRGGDFDGECGAFIFNEASSYKNKTDGYSTSPAYHYRVLTNGNNAEDSYGNVSPAGEWLHIEPKEGYVAKVTIGDTVKYYTESEGYYPLPELTGWTSETDVLVTFSEKASTEPAVGDTAVAVISIADSENGTVTSSKEYCLVNGTDAITLTVTPDEGYNLTGLSVKKDGVEIALDKAITSIGGEYSFVPEAGTYTVEATFTAKEYGAIGGTISGATSGTITATDTTTGEVYTFVEALCEDGSYGISVPVGTYSVSVDSRAMVGAVAGVTVTKDKVAEQNLVLKNKMNNYFTITNEGYYKCTKDYGQNYFVDGYGSQWVAELTVPELNTNNVVGFVLHQRADGKITWGNWIRIGVQKASDGTYKLYAQMSVDGNTNLQATTTYTISDTSVPGKTFQLLLLDGELIASLDDKVIKKFANSTKLLDTKGTVGEVLGNIGTDEIYCGLLASKAGIVIPDWSYNKISALTEKYTVSGTVSAKLNAATDLNNATITFANKTYAVKTYATTVGQDGTYSIQVPSGDYKVTVSYSKYYENNTFECSVASENITKDFTLRKNTIYNNATGNYFTMTEDGYKALKKEHNLIQSSSGTQWVVDMELPSLAANEEAGFVLVKKSDGIKWGYWMRILITKTNDGKIKLFTQMHVDNSFDEATSIDLPITSTEGKVLEVVLLNKRIYVLLEGEVFAEYDSNTTMIAGSTNTVANTFGTLGNAEIYCGLYVQKDKVIKDWGFTNKIDTATYTVSGTVSAGLSVANVSSASITFVNEADTTQTYTVKPDANGKYSVTVPSGSYKVTVSYSKYYEDNTLDCDVLLENVTKDIVLRKNTIYLNYENNTAKYFEMTEDGYYKALKKEHTLFQSAAGKQWVANMELPSLAANEEAGFVLIQKDNGVKWGRWMRILVTKAEDGTIKLFTQMHVDGLFDEATAQNIAITATEGKVLEVALVYNTIHVSLDGKLLAQYDSNSTMKENSAYTVETTFGKLGTYELYCGLYVQKDKLIKDWGFSNVIDTNTTYTVSGKVSTSLASANVADATITFVNAADTSKVYEIKPNTEGNYSIELPTGGYKATVSYAAYYVDHTFDCSVAFGDVTQDISLTKNKVNNEGNSFEVTEDGNYQSVTANSHNRFQSGYGSAWVASLELPDMADGKGVGFVLHQRENNTTAWGKWMRILVKKTSGEAIELYTQMHLDKQFNDGTTAYDEATTVYVPETYVAGKTLQVALINSNIIVTLDGTVIATYDSDSKLKADGEKTVGAVFGDLTEAYCGLLANNSGIVIKDWSFNNVLDASKEYTVSGTVSAGLVDADVSKETLTFVNKADESKVYTVKPNAQGKYSVQVPSGDYKVTVSYSERYVDNIFDCRVVHSDVTQDFSLRKNKVSSQSTQFNVTTEGYYQSIPGDYTHNTFLNGYGSRWVASLELPDVQAGQGVGFVLCKREDSVQYGKWMRILVKKANDGTIELYTQMHLDGSFDEATTVYVSETYAAGKTLQVSLVNGKITVTLDGVVIVQYDKNTKLEASHTNTVGDVFGELAVINCGLLANGTGIVIKDWNFSNVSNVGDDYLEGLMVALGGKTLSVLGDSISTWGGVSNNTAYNATIGTNNPYYNGGNMTALTALNQTYWGSVMEKYSMSLCVNNSFSSGRLVDDWTAASNGVHIPSALDRCTELGNKNGITPDVIAIYIGTNDFKTAKTEGVYTTAEDFGAAYQEMLDSIATKYSGAKVFCFTLIPNNQRTDQTEWNAYNDKIRTVVANNSFATLVDIAQNSGIDWNNYTKYTVDGVHPNLAGMKKIADVFKNALYATYVQ